MGRRDLPHGGGDTRYVLLLLPPLLPPWPPPSPALLGVVEAAAVLSSIPLDALGSKQRRGREEGLSELAPAGSSGAGRGHAGGSAWRPRHGYAVAGGGIGPSS
jgi:hypothetical protein